MSASSLKIPLKSNKGFCVFLEEAIWWDNSAVGAGRQSLLARLVPEPFRCQSVSYCSQVQSPTELRGSRRDFESQTVFRRATCLVWVRASSASHLLSSKPCGHFMLTVCPRAPGGWHLVVLAMAWMLYLPGSCGSNPTAFGYRIKVAHYSRARQLVRAG